MAGGDHGLLSVVATPIGCLDDITLRALHVLKTCDVILAEDTRHTKKLSTRFDITTTIRAVHEHTPPDKIAAWVDKLRAGAHFALVSDAGTPLISDPGRQLVQSAVDAGVRVEAIPGASAVTAALSIAGLPFKRFAFEGFLPRTGTARRVALERIASTACAVVVFESPHRIVRTLKELAEVGSADRTAAVCRELTKVHEEVLRGSIEQLPEMLPEPVRGEITLVLGPVHQTEDAVSMSAQDIRDKVDAWRSDGLRHKEMAARLREATGWSRDAAYQAVLDALTALESDDFGNA